MEDIVREAENADDIFDDVIDENELFEPLEPLPDLRNDEEKVASGTQNRGALNSLTAAEEKLAGKKRKTVKRVVLNEKRLLSERGIRALPTYFENVKFKGKGHEASDLDLLLRRYELWAHSLFPRHRFETVATRVEELCSTSSRLKGVLTNMRLGIQVDDDQHVSRRIDEEHEAQTLILNESIDLPDQHFLF